MNIETISFPSYSVTSRMMVEEGGKPALSFMVSDGTITQAKSSKYSTEVQSMM